jgi:catechol 2,3-dioxygenase-like lactoylglutathione lyase family enzyme
VTAATSSPDDCYCCGQTVPREELARMLCHPEVAICPGCAEWLATWSRTFVRAVPVLRTDDLRASLAFWEAAGFEAQRLGDDFAVAQRDGVELHLVELPTAGPDGGGAYLHTRDADAIRAAWSAAGLPVGELRDRPWGMREFDVVDPGGNRIRIGQSI